MAQRDECAALAERVVEELWSAGRWSTADQLCAPDVSIHVLHEHEPVEGVAAFEEVVEQTRAAFPDYRADVQEVVGEYDRVFVRWVAHATNDGAFLGFPATGKPVALNEIALFRCDDGKVRKLWYMPDVAGAVNQLGLAPPAAVVKAMSLLRRLGR